MFFSFLILFALSATTKVSAKNVRSQRKLPHCAYAAGDFDSPTSIGAPGDGETVTLNQALAAFETGAWTMEAKAGCQYTFNIVSGSGDPYVQVLAPDLTILGSCGVSTWVAPSDGVVLVAVDEYMGTAISYTLDITGTGSSCTAAICGSFPCGKQNNKVSVCHLPNGDPSKAKTLCIGDAEDHFNDHSADYCGECAN